MLVRDDLHAPAVHQHLRAALDVFEDTTQILSVVSCRAEEAKQEGQRDRDRNRDGASQCVLKKSVVYNFCFDELGHTSTEEMQLSVS